MRVDIINKKKVCIIFLVFILVFVGISNTCSTVYASWTEKADKSIYGKDATVGSSTSDSLTDLLASEKPGLIEGFLIELIVAITNALYKLMDAIGITLDSVIYGRVGGHTKDGINVFRFELQKGNPYGVVGSAIYTVIAGISIIIIAVTIFGKMAATMYSSGSAHKRDEFKSSIITSILSVALIFYMPYFLDVLLYLADVVLSAVSNEGATKLFATSDGFDIVKTFEEFAHNSIVNALIYLSTIILSFYFAAVYIGYALSMVVLFITFPMIAIGMNFDKKLLSQWVKQVLSIVIIPIMDCVLMMIPTYMGLLPRSGSMAIVKIFVCASIIPSRNIIRQLLGLSTSNGLDITGVATMLGAFKLAETAGRTFSHNRKLRRGAREDMNMANFYQEAANMETGGMSGGGSMALGIGGVSNPGGGHGAFGGPVNLSSAGGAISTGSVSYMGNASDSIFNSANSEIGSGSLAEKYANIHNFENPLIRSGLSNQKMADLYRERAKTQAKRALYSSVGSAIGGMAGLGSSMFLSPASKSYMGAMGMMAGGSIGDMLADSVPFASIRPANLTGKGRGESDSIEGTILGSSSVGGAAVDPYPVDLSGISTVANYNAASTELANDSIDKNVEEFCNVNAFEGYRTIVNVMGEYTANNGELFKSVYNEVAEKNMGSSSENIYYEFRKKVASDIISKFNESMDKNTNIRYFADNRVNKLGREEYTKKLENSLNDMNNGILSKEILKRYGITTDGLS